MAPGSAHGADDQRSAPASAASPWRCARPAARHCRHPIRRRSSALKAAPRCGPTRVVAAVEEILSAGGCGEVRRRGEQVASAASRSSPDARGAHGARHPCPRRRARQRAFCRVRRSCCGRRSARALSWPTLPPSQNGAKMSTKPPCGACAAPAGQAMREVLGELYGEARACPTGETALRHLSEEFPMPRVDARHADAAQRCMVTIGMLVAMAAPRIARPSRRRTDQWLHPEEFAESSPMAGLCRLPGRDRGDAHGRECCGCRRHAEKSRCGRNPCRTAPQSRVRGHGAPRIFPAFVHRRTNRAVRWAGEARQSVGLRPASGAAKTRAARRGSAGV